MADTLNEVLFGGNENQNETTYNQYIQEPYSESLKTKEIPSLSGTESLINGYALFALSSSQGNNNRLLDINPDISIRTNIDPTASNLVKRWKDTKAKQPYYWSDFLYNSHYGLIPNNYMITLRRFPVPVFDNLKFPDNKTVPPLSQAVTWFSEDLDNKISDIMSFSYGFNWELMETDVWDVNYSIPGGDSSPVGGIGLGKYGRSVGGVGVNNVSDVSGLFNTRNTDPTGAKTVAQKYEEGLYENAYWNKVLGPVNVINKTHKRNRGLEFIHDSISIKFEWKLKSFANVNPKAAILDILSNFLALTYNNAQFFGGAYRFFPDYPDNPFVGDYNLWYSGKFPEYFKSVENEIGGILGVGGNFLQTLFDDPQNAIKKLVSGIGNSLFGRMSKRGRPEIMAMKSMLTGNPVGEWHLVLGDPYNPFAMIGNLILESSSISFGDVLGYDGFPETIKAEVKLKHAKPRDKSDIESMFNDGNGRLYYTKNDAPDILNSSASTRSTEISTLDEKKQQDGKKSVDSNIKSNTFDDYASVGNHAFHKVGGFDQQSYSAFSNVFGG